MVNAKLHIICGNCGSTDLAYEHSNIKKQVGDEDYDGTHLRCEDCATLHFLDEINNK